MGDANSSTDELGWLRLQLEWGADEAIEDLPIDRRGRPAPPPAARVQPEPPLAGRALPAHATPGVTGAVARAQALAAAATTVEALREALANFDGCALRATATSLVFSDGDPAARIMLVADVPGSDEDRSGLPFAGPATHFLDRMLDSAGVPRAATRSTSLLPWRPPGGRKPAEAEIQVCLPFLLRHLQLAPPHRLLLFGGLAIRALLGADARRARAGWQDLVIPGLAGPLPTLAFPAIPHIQATPAAKRDAWANLLLLRRARDASTVDHD